MLAFVPNHLPTCPKPICSSCQLGKADQSAIPSLGTPLDSGHLQPGDCISVNQLESNTPGLVPTTHGTPTSCKFQIATLICDHASCFIHLTCHLSTGAVDAVTAKWVFEHEATLADVHIKKYKADNGIFNSAAWRSSCDSL
jgi:hypothetical protein